MFVNCLSPGEREWTSPLTERQQYDDREEQKSGYDAPRRYDSRHPDPRRPEAPPLSGTVVHRNCPSPAGLEAPPPRFERERLSPLHQKDSADMSPVPRFESPNSEHSDDGPLNVDAPPRSLPHPPKSILKAPSRGGPLSVRQHSSSPGHTPPHDGGHPSARYNGPGNMGPSRPHPPGWYEGGGPGRFEDALLDGPHHQGPSRFDGPHHNMLDPGQPEGPHVARASMRGRDEMGRFDGPQGPGRFGPIGQPPSARYEGQGSGHFNNMGPGPGPVGFQQQRPMCFDAPSNQMGPMRFEGPGQPGPRYDVPHQAGPQRFDYNPGQQGPPRFGSQHNLQPTMRQMVPPMYDNSMAPQQNFPMVPQRFPEPINPQFPAGPMAFASQQGGNFNMQTPFSQPAPGPYYNPSAPAVGLQQPVSDAPTHVYHVCKDGDNTFKCLSGEHDGKLPAAEHSAFWTAG